MNISTPFFFSNTPPNVKGALSASPQQQGVASEGLMKGPKMDIDLVDKMIKRVNLVNWRKLKTTEKTTETGMAPIPSNHIRHHVRVFL